MAAAPLILAFGDSLTAGYGLPRAETFPAQLEARLRKLVPDTVVLNAGVSGDTTSGALARLPRLLSGLSQRPDLAIVELGANDLIRRIAPERTRANLDAILSELSRCAIPVLLTTIEAPRFLGPLAETCDAIYVDVARRHGAAVTPFFPEGVMGRPGFTLADRLHPNRHAISLVADAMLPVVVSLLQNRRSQAA